MPGVIIAVANAKGGVGKTTTSVSLAEACAAAGRETLVIDFDAQANASVAVAGGESLVRLIDREKTVEAYIATGLLARTPQPIRRFIATGASRTTHRGGALPLSLMAASFRLRVSERDILVGGKGGRAPRWEEVDSKIRALFDHDFAELRERYDVVILDCAPGISGFTETAIKLSDLVITPTIPDFVSTLGLAGFTQFVSRLADDARATRLRGDGFERPVVLATRVQTARPDHAEYLARLRDEASRPDGAFEMFDVHMPEVGAISTALEAADAADPAAEAPAFERRWGETYGAALAALRDEALTRAEAVRPRALAPAGRNRRRAG